MVWAWRVRRMSTIGKKFRFRFLGVLWQVIIEFIYGYWSIRKLGDSSQFTLNALSQLEHRKISYSLISIICVVTKSIPIQNRIIHSNSGLYCIVNWRNNYVLSSCAFHIPRLSFSSHWITINMRIRSFWLRRVFSASYVFVNAWAVMIVIDKSNQSFNYCVNTIHHSILWRGNRIFTCTFFPNLSF